MKSKTAIVTIIGVYAIDCLIITPYILWKRLGREGGLLMSFGYSKIGLIWFPLWFLLFVMIISLIIPRLFKFYDRLLGENAKYPKYAAVITWTLGMIFIIINNLRYIK